jgi:serine/threonine kinase 32
VGTYAVSNGVEISALYMLILVLKVHMERRGGIEEDVVRFWVAEISSALEYLHQQRIIHRDLKPDNILLDARGHAHITDFNVAIHYSERRLHTSVAGSMAYMAPEVIGRKGYTWCIDWWSLGITAYELLFRKRPFEGRSADKMTNSIMNATLKFPDNAAASCSAEGIDVVRSVGVLICPLVPFAHHRMYSYWTGILATD